MGSLRHVVEDCHGVLQVYSDGSIFRLPDIHIPFNIPVQDDGSVIWSDRLFDKKHNLFLRIYKPAAASAAKVPIVYFIHGGGFCLSSRTWPHIHNCCLRISSRLQAVVLAPDYRLAPEHRLPAAMDDSVTAITWLQAQALSKNIDTWLSDRIDFDRVFVLGDSSGGNVAHHLAVLFGPGSPETAPVRIRGYVLLAPFFGGTVRTESEAKGEPEPLLNVELLDRFWRLSLPVGSTADHPFANPFGPGSPDLESVKLDPILVIGGGKELLKDRVEGYATRLKDMGKKVEYVEFEGQHHGFLMEEPYSQVSNTLLKVIENFMCENSA